VGGHARCPSMIHMLSGTAWGREIPWDINVRPVNVNGPDFSAGRDPA
jgi:hypothetical protein